MSHVTTPPPPFTHAPACVSPLYRSRRLSAKEVRETFKTRMGWTDQETVALIGGGHTLGRSHGNCASHPNSADKSVYKGEYTTTAGYEGAWTRTPSKWNYDFFEAMFEGDWVPSKSPEGADQWNVADTDKKWSGTFRLTADLALVSDPIYKVSRTRGSPFVRV